MNKKKLDELKAKLLHTKEQILNGTLLRSTDDLCISSEDLPDEADIANSVINQQVTFSIREREIKKLRLIENALRKVETGEYGLCEDCDEEISIKRLENSPWAELCITHAEEQERNSVGRVS